MSNLLRGLEMHGRLTTILTKGEQGRQLFRFLLAFSVHQALLKHPGGWVVSVPNFGSSGLRFKFSWRQNSAHNCMAFYCIEPFIITSCHLDMTNVEREVTHHQAPSEKGSTLCGNKLQILFRIDAFSEGRQDFDRVSSESESILLNSVNSMKQKEGIIHMEYIWKQHSPILVSKQAILALLLAPGFYSVGSSR